MTKLLVLAVALAACNSAKDDYIKNRKQDQATDNGPDKSSLPPPAKKKVLLADSELGQCHITATGAIPLDQTSQGGKAATNVSYWYAADEQKTMMGVDGFVVNCNGDGLKFSMVPAGKPDGMPFKPKKYTFDKGKGDAALIINFGKQALANATGSIDVTAFDSHHIAGAIDLDGQLGGADEKLAGTFDLICPNLSACNL